MINYLNCSGTIGRVDKADSRPNCNGHRDVRISLNSDCRKVYFPDNAAILNKRDSSFSFFNIRASASVASKSTIMFPMNVCPIQYKKLEVTGKQSEQNDTTLRK